MLGDYFGRDELLLAGLSEQEADAVLALSGQSGNDGRPCVAADQLDVLLMVVRDEREDELT
jgi:hypothetical protein